MTKPIVAFRSFENAPKKHFSVADSVDICSTNENEELEQKIILIMLHFRVAPVFERISVDQF